MSPWFWVPALFVSAMGAKRWMPLFAGMAVLVVVVGWEQMLADVVLWLSK